MKKSILACCIITMGATTNLKAQVSQLGNTGFAGNYVGWDNSNNFPLQFRHENNSANSRFEWYTNIGGTTAERMRLTQTGFLGLGTNAPSSFFHLNTTTTGELFRTDGAGANLTFGT